MSDTGNPFGFGKFVPGFDFLQNLMTAAARGSGGGAQLPGLSSWIAPTLSVEDLERRIGELKAVHFWLEQNSRALAATIQALEVQKMSLATLRGMNVAMGDVAKAFSIKPPASMGAAQPGERAGDSLSPKEAAKAYAKSFETPVAARPPSGEPDAAADAGESSAAKQAARAYARSFETPVAARPRGDEPAAEDAAAGQAQAQESPRPGAGASGAIDPMQWWGALTGQFQQIAANAMRDAAGANPALQMSRNLASSALESVNEMTQSLAAAGRRRGAAKQAAGKQAAGKQAAGKRGSARKSAAAKGG